MSPLMASPDIHTVLLVGEASGVHDALKYGLIANGVQVRHMIAYLPRQGRATDGAFATARPGLVGSVTRNVEPFYRIARLPRYDVVNFLNTTSAVHGMLMRYRDMPLFRSKAGLLSYYAVGCDELGIVRRNAELPYSPCAGCLRDDGDLARDCTNHMDVRYDRSVAEARRWFDYGACSMVEYSHVSAAFEHVPDAILLPIRFDRIDYTPANRGDGPVRIVHAPTRRGFKGADVVEAAIRLLGGRRADFTFRIVEDLPHAEYLTTMREADVVIDQVHSQSAGVSALEMLATGKVVLTGATAAGHAYQARSAESPAFDASPDPAVLADTLAEILDRRDQFEQMGRQGRAYVIEHHDPAKVARQFLAGWASRMAHTPAAVG